MAFIGQKRSIFPQVPESFFTGSSKEATVRRLMPKMLRNSIQNSWLSDRSEVVSFQSREKEMARLLISFQESMALAFQKNEG